MKLFTRYNWFNISLMVFLFVLSGTILHQVVSNVLVHEVDEALEKYRKHIIAFARQDGALPVFRNFEEVQLSYHHAPAGRKSFIRQIYLYNPEDHRAENFRQLVFTQSVRGKWYEVRVAKPLDGTRRLARTIAYSTLTMLLAFVAISVLLNQLLLRKLWRPFYASIQVMQQFRLGSGHEPAFKETAIEEFSFLNKELSGVLNNARQDYRILKEFTENASHETQTPLAIIRAKLDLVIQEEGLSGTQSEALKSAYAAVSRLAKLNQSLLLLAKIGNLQFAATELIGLKERVLEKLVQFNEFWDMNQFIMEISLQPALLRANAALMDVLLNNLLSNAGRYNVRGGEIRISLSAGLLEISNTAVSGALDQDRLFRRFYKASVNTPGNGLGLSIVKEICDHSGILLQYVFQQNHHVFKLEWTAE